jgi:hypothetical protein
MADAVLAAARAIPFFFSFPRLDSISYGFLGWCPSPCLSSVYSSGLSRSILAGKVERESSVGTPVMSLFSNVG